MAVSVREADLKRDSRKLITFLHNNLTGRSNDSRYKWLYLDNPSGPARAWIASDDATGKTVGFGAAFPRSVWFDCRPERAWVLGDLCVAPGSRSLGPALLLQRSCLTSLAANNNPIWFDFPSRSMMAVYRRLGVTATGNHVRYVKLFRIDKKVERHIPVKSLSDCISRIGNLALKLHRAKHRVRRNIEISVYEDAFRDEFTTLDRRTADNQTIRTLRSAEHLNWRYRQDPFNRYRVVVARREGRLLGYAILEVTEPGWLLSDLQAVEQDDTIPSILAFIDRLAGASNVDSISIPVMEGTPLIVYLCRAGFYARETTPIVARVEQESAALGPNSRNWFLLHGDRES